MTSLDARYLTEYSASIRLRTTKQKAQQKRNQRPFQQLEHAPRLFRTQRRRQRHRAVGLPLHHHAIALALDRVDYQQVFVGRAIERNAIVRRSGKGTATAADAGRLRGALLGGRTDKFVEIHAEMLEHTYGGGTAGDIDAAARMLERPHQIESVDAGYGVLRQIRRRAMPA